MKKIALIVATSLFAISAFAQTKFAHVNYSELVQLCPEADQARATMAASQQEAQETFQAMVEEYQSKLSTYQSKASTWTASILQSKEKELTDIQQRIQEFEQTVSAELQQQQQTLMAPITQKAIDVVKQLAKEGGYIYVFDESTLLYFDASQSVSLTPAARKALNIPDDRTMESLQAELQAQAQAQAEAGPAVQ